MGMTHLVTGGAGFIGSHLVEVLCDWGQRVVVVDNLSGGFKSNLDDRADFWESDVADITLEGVDVVWHLAAYAAEGLSHWVREFNVRNNWLASTHLINEAVKHGTEFVFTSSMAVYGSQEPPYTEDMTPRPEDPYGIAKYAVEADLKAAGEVFDLPYVIFRPHNVYGPRQNLGDPYRNVVGIFMRQALQGGPLTVFGDGEQTRAFSHVSDIVTPMLAAGMDGETYNIGGETVYTINQLAQSVSDLFGGVPIEHLPERYEVKHAYCDHAKARERLGFEPTVELKEGLAEMKTWAERAGIQWSKTPALELTKNLPEFWC